jgi:hypothetical protein
MIPVMYNLAVECRDLEMGLREGESSQIGILNDIVLICREDSAGEDLGMVVQGAVSILRLTRVPRMMSR